MLGPILFTIFVNDLSESIDDCEVMQYADDTQFIHSGTLDSLPHFITQAQTTLTRAKNYFNTNGLMLNSKKTQCLFVGTRALTKRIPENTVIMFDHTLITPSKYVKNIEIYMDCNLNFDTHINEIYKKFMGTLLFLNRIKDKFEKDTRTIEVKSLSLGVIYYCLPIYGSTSNALLHRVQKLPNFAAKICVGGAKKSAHATPFIEQLQWLKVKNKIILDVAVSVFKITNNMFPEWFLQLPTVSAAIHNKCTRQQKKQHTPTQTTVTVPSRCGDLEY